MPLLMGGAAVGGTIGDISRANADREANAEQFAMSDARARDLAELSAILELSGRDPYKNALSQAAAIDALDRQANTAPTRLQFDGSGRYGMGNPTWVGGYDPSAQAKSAAQALRDHIIAGQGTTASPLPSGQGGAAGIDILALLAGGDGPGGSGPEMNQHVLPPGGGTQPGLSFPGLRPGEGHLGSPPGVDWNHGRPVGPPLKLDPSYGSQPPTTDDPLPALLTPPAAEDLNRPMAPGAAGLAQIARPRRHATPRGRVPSLGQLSYAA